MSRFGFGYFSGRGTTGQGGLRNQSGRQGVCRRDGSGSFFGAGLGRGNGLGNGRGLRDGSCRLDSTRGRGGFFSRVQGERPVTMNNEASAIERLQASIEALQQQIAELRKPD